MDGTAGVGGVPGRCHRRIVYGVTGYTVNSVEGLAFRIRYLLNNPDLARQMGENAREHVRQNFLILRDLADHLALVSTLLG